MPYRPSDDPNLADFRAYWNGLTDAERAIEHRRNLNAMREAAGEVPRVDHDGVVKLDSDLMDVPSAQPRG